MREVLKALDADLRNYGTFTLTVVDNEYEFAIIRHVPFTVEDLFYA